MATHVAGTFARSSSTSSSPANPSSKSPFSGVAKPNVIRKLARPSEKTSLDLNRSSVEQGLGLYYASEYGGGSGSGASRSLHDLSVNSTIAARRTWHQRSTSGTSQFSTRTAGSLGAGAAGYRGGEGFRHPWQQTPRPYTPPGGNGSHQGSFAESEGRETPTLGLGLGEMEERREQSVLGEAMTPPLWVNTKSSERTRLPLGTTSSNSLHLSSSLSILGEHNRATNTNTTTLASLSPSDTVSPISFTPRSRTSMDRGYRLRSRSDLERRQVESVREARRKWDEREREKEERIAREQVKQREKQERREAKKIEKGGRKSSTSERSRQHGDSGPKYSFQEKRGPADQGLFARDYDSAPVQTPPQTEQEYGRFPPPQPKHSSPGAEAKRRTHSAWTSFMMWLRTRILRMREKH